MSRLPATSLATSHKLRAAGATSYESRTPAWARHPTTQGIQTPTTLKEPVTGYELQELQATYPRAHPITQVTSTTQGIQNPTTLKGPATGYERQEL